MSRKGKGTRIHFYLETRKGCTVSGQSLSKPISSRNKLSYQNITIKYTQPIPKHIQLDMFINMLLS